MSELSSPLITLAVLGIVNDINFAFSETRIFWCVSAADPP
jgi:hypothetical protein